MSPHHVVIMQINLLRVQFKVRSEGRGKDHVGDITTLLFTEALNTKSRNRKHSTH